MNGRVAKVQRMDLGGFLAYWWSNQETIGEWRTAGDAVAAMLALGFEVIPGPGGYFAMGPDMRECSNIECRGGAVPHRMIDDELETCGICQGTTVIHCECGRSPATVTDMDNGEEIRCCPACKAETAAARAGVVAEGRRAS